MGWSALTLVSPPADARPRTRLDAALQPGPHCSPMRSLPAFTALLLLLGSLARAQSIYDIPVKDIDGKATSLAPFKGRVLLVVNVASHCGFTPQYEQLQAGFDKYKDRGLTV